MSVRRSRAKSRSLRAAAGAWAARWSWISPERSGCRDRPLSEPVDVNEELLDRVIGVGVNLKGPFRLTALIGDRMANGDGGSIINISSVAAIRPTPNDLPYSRPRPASTP